ncbi:MAG: DUF4404 family protein [Bdellovibrionales bacterium]|nr:DUF4404 family protein [Bdellovibrionales bacterium]
MSQNEIHRHTEALLQQLKSEDSMSEGERKELQELALKIQSRLKEQNTDEGWEEYQNHLEKVAIDFQEQYPTLSELFRRVSQALSNLGI